MKMKNLTLFFIFAMSLPAGTLIAGTSSLLVPDNWYAYRSNGKPKITFEDDKITFSDFDKGSYAWSYFSPQSLSVGQQISVTGTLLFSGVSSTANTKFCVGLFDSKTNTKSSLDEKLAKEEITKTEGQGCGINANGKSDTLGIKLLTGAMTGIFTDCEKAYGWKTEHPSTGFLATNGSAATQVKSEAFSASLPAPVSQKNFDFSFTLALESAENIAITIATCNNDVGGSVWQSATERISLNSVGKFDVFALKLPTGTAQNIIFSNISLRTAPIPEPSILSLFFGLGALALVHSRRKRKE